jgi:hypothetical protein
MSAFSSLSELKQTYHYPGSQARGSGERASWSGAAKFKVLSAIALELP